MRGQGSFVLCIVIYLPLLPNPLNNLATQVVVVVVRFLFFLFSGKISRFRVNKLKVWPKKNAIIELVKVRTLKGMLKSGSGTITIVAPVYLCTMSITSQVKCLITMKKMIDSFKIYVQSNITSLNTQHCRGKIKASIRIRRKLRECQKCQIVLDQYLCSTCVCFIFCSVFTWEWYFSVSVLSEATHMSATFENVMAKKCEGSTYPKAVCSNESR